MHGISYRLWGRGGGQSPTVILGLDCKKDTVLLGAALLTAADSLRAAHAGNRS